MCYPKPGPRCSKHAAKILKNALESRDKARIDEAKKEFFTTPQGIQKLEAMGKTKLAGEFAERRKTMIAASKAVSEANKAAKEAEKTAKAQARRDAPKKPFFQTRKGRILAVGTTGFLAASLMTGCSTETDADYAQVCQDAKSQQRVSDDKCSDEGRSSGVYGFYYLPIGGSSTTNVPAVGKSLSGGTTKVESGKTIKSGISSKGSSISKGGFSSGSKGGGARGGSGG